MIRPLGVLKGHECPCRAPRGLLVDLYGLLENKKYMKSTKQEADNKTSAITGLMKPYEVLQGLIAL